MTVFNDDLYCAGCKKRVIVELVKGDVIYPHREDLYNLNFYKCKCGLYVGCHKGTTKALGVIPTEADRKARGIIHKIIDPLWKNKLIDRKDLYKIISDKIHKEFHAGDVVSQKEIDRITEICLNIKKELEEKKWNCK